MDCRSLLIPAGGIMVNASLQKNSSVRLSIESLSSDGAGVAHVGGMAVFVPFTAPGDVVNAKIVKVCKTHAVDGTES